jgi:hypothetical protein
MSLRTVFIDLISSLIYIKPGKLIGKFNVVYYMQYTILE